MNAPATPRLHTSPIGAEVPHDSATLHVSGGAHYTDDLPEPRGTLHAAFGVSPIAHGAIKRCARRAPRSRTGDARNRPASGGAHHRRSPRRGVVRATGEHRLLAVDILHDAGRSLNPAIDRGQIASVDEHRTLPHLDAPATPERVLPALTGLRVRTAQVHAGGVPLEAVQAPSA